jgi:RimJ/RimL family protein N-acetyltransferase
MIKYDNGSNDILSLYTYFNYQNLIKSLLFRKQDYAHLIVSENSAMILWGPCIFIGGEFSQSISESIMTILQNSYTPRYIYLPDGEWNSFIKHSYPNQLRDKQLNLYQTDNIGDLNFQANSKYIIPISKTLLERNLPNTQIITNELYSYLNMEDFFQNGFGLALVIDNTVYGYCLSEYSIDNGCGINIWVDEKYRRLGYAKMMTNLFLKNCYKHKWKAFWGCNSDNAASNKVALSSGFVLHSTLHYFEWEN